MTYIGDFNSHSDSLETAAKVIVSLDHNGEDELVNQARSFIQVVLTLFSSHGLFNTLCKVRFRNTDFLSGYL